MPSPVLDRVDRPSARPLPDPVAVRRAVALLVVGVVVPGSAQLVAGDRRVGRVVVRVWLCLLAAGLVLGAGWFLARGLMLGLLTSSFVLALVALGCFVAALAMAALTADAWRIGRPRELPRRARPWLAALAATLVLVTAGPLVAAGQRSWAAADMINTLFPATRVSDAVDGRFNVLLLGGDAGPDRVGTRPDSVTLASIDAGTGRTVLFSLPRNLENVPFAPGTPAAKAMPKGWSCGDTCLLNAIYTWGAQHRELFPGVADSGAEAMKDAVEGVTGLTVNYYVMIDLAGFEQLVDAFGGITVTVKQRVPIGGGTSKVSGYLEPGTQKLDGYHALWLARSRHGASDYDRMARQRCVMDAMLAQLDPATVLARFQSIAAASKSVVSTDVPAGELATFIDLAVKAKGQRTTSVQFVPPLVKPAFPDYRVIRDAVTTALEQSRSGAAPSKPAASKPAASKPASSKPAASAGGPSGAAPTGPVDVRSTCSPA